MICQPLEERVSYGGNLISVVLFCPFCREVTNSQSSVSMVVSGSSSGSSHQHQHPIMPSTSPLSQYTPNGEVQKIRTTTPPHNLSNPQTQQRGEFFESRIFNSKLFRTLSGNQSDIYVEPIICQIPGILF